MRQISLVYLLWSAGVLIGAAPACFGNPVSTTDPEATLQNQCSGCHGDGGAGGDRAPALINSARVRGMSESEIKAVVNKGLPGGMPAFALQDRDLSALAQWLHERNTSALASPA